MNGEGDEKETITKTFVTSRGTVVEIICPKEPASKEVKEEFYRKLAFIYLHPKVGRATT